MERSSFPRTIHCTGYLVPIRLSHHHLPHKLGFVSGLSILIVANMWMSCVPIPCCLDDGRLAFYLEIKQLVTYEICTSC